MFDFLKILCYNVYEQSFDYIKIERCVIMQLTKKQQIIYDFICTFTLENGYSPSIREIGEGVGLKSPATVYTHIENLKALGVLEKTAMKNRALSIKGLNEKMQENINSSHTDDGDSETAHIPVLGKVAAGQPIFATENIERTFPLPIDMVGNSDTFMLRVQGESMINAGILDGDYIIVKRQPSAENGDMVVALIDDEATVKTFYKEDGYFRLQPENDAMQPIIVNKMTILGVVTGLIRKY